MKLFLSPHNDDECLFGALMIMREKLLVVVVYDGYVQGNRGVGVFATQRRLETISAMEELGCSMPPKFLGLRDDCAYTPDDVVFRLRSVVDVDQTFESVYAPMYDLDGHAQHNIVSLAADKLNAASHVRYSTYTRNGGRQRTQNEVSPTNGDMIARKHRALACYASQMDVDTRIGTWSWFCGDMREYTA